MYIYILFSYRVKTISQCSRLIRLMLGQITIVLAKKIVTLTCVDEFGEIRRFTDS